MKNTPLVSVIIANWNGGKYLEDTLSSLSKIDYPNWELIVVDNGSTDGSQKFAKIKNKENLGFAPANNQALNKVCGKYLLLLNNDTKVTKNFLSILVSKMEDDDTIGVVQPKILMMDDPNYLDNAGSFFTFIGFLEHWGFGRKDSREYSRERQVFSCKGACMLVRSRVVKKIGLFDDDFVSYFEESDFCWRVWLSGWKVLYYPKAKIYHKVGYTVRRLDVGNINFHYYKNRLMSLIKNLGTLNLFLVLPVHLLISFGISFLFLLRGNVKNSRMILDAILWNIRNLENTLGKRKKVQELRTVSDKEIFKNLSRPVNFGKFFNDFKRVEEDLKRKNV